MNSSELMAGIRDLAVLLHRANVQQAEPVIQEIIGCLESLVTTGAGVEDAGTKRAEQTLFAIEEARTLMTEGNFRQAAIAARDAGREWSQPPQ